MIPVGQIVINNHKPGGPRANQRLVSNYQGIKQPRRYKIPDIFTWDRGGFGIPIFFKIQQNAERRCMAAQFAVAAYSTTLILNITLSTIHGYVSYWLISSIETK